EGQPIVVHTAAAVGPEVLAVAWSPTTGESLGTTPAEAPTPDPSPTHARPSGALPNRSFDAAGVGNEVEPRAPRVVEVVEPNALTPPLVVVGARLLAAVVVLPWWLRPIPVPRPASAIAKPSDAAVRARRTLRRR